MDERPYRRCVVGVFIDSTGQVLVGQRKKAGGWQFPQGGVDEGEEYEDSLFREMEEELGSKNFSILKTSTKLYRYEFPSDMNIPMSQKYRGQEQQWFLCTFHRDARPDLALAKDEEFSALKWVSIDFVMKEVIFWKKDCYEQALIDLGLL